MLFRNCAGGVVFYGKKVFLLQKEKKEWVLPKGLIREEMTPQEVAAARVLAEAGIRAKVVCPAGHTSYEFYSLTRQKPVCNEVRWFVMEAESDACSVSAEQGFADGGWFSREEAIAKITYSQDRKLLEEAFHRREAKR